MRPRRFWQFHLSTALLMMLLAGAMLPFPLSYLPRDFKKYARDVEWDLSGTVGDVRSSAVQNKSSYAVGVTKSPKGFFMESDVVVTDTAGNEAGKFGFRAGEETPFLIKDDVLYFADHGPISSGCTLEAFDLKNKKLKWRTGLMGIGPVSHSKYRNKVNLKIHDDVIVVYGNETSGKYVEFVDSKTGRTWANKGYHTDFSRRYADAELPLTFYDAPKTDRAGLAISIGVILGTVICAAFVCEYLIRRRKGGESARGELRDAVFPRGGA